jgi:hypothetical protein
MIIIGIQVFYDYKFWHHKSNFTKHIYIPLTIPLFFTSFQIGYYIPQIFYDFFFSFLTATTIGLIQQQQITD